jgi:long-chain fatty acid transport protein
MRTYTRSARNRLLSFHVAAALLLGSTGANAAGFALLEQSSSRLGTAFAGSGAAADDATTLFYNPAGLTRLGRGEAAALPSAIEITSEFHDTGSRSAIGQPLGNSGGDAGGWNLAPSIYMSTPLSDNLVVGLGVNAPFGLKLEYDSGWIGRFQAINSELKTMNFNPTVAYRINERVAVGVGLNYQRIQAELTNAVNYSAVIAQGLQQLVAAGQLSPAAVPGLIAANAGLEGNASVRGDDDAWGYNVGLMFDLSDATRLGLSYRSTTGYKLEGFARFTPPTVTQSTGAAIVGAASAAGGPLATGPASVSIKMPDSALLSLRQKLGSKMELLADIGWTGWSTIQELRVVRDSGATVSATPEHWNDTWRFALGATYAFTPTMKLRGGAAIDETPVPDATRTPRLPDTDRTWLTLGWQWQPTDAITADVGYAHLFCKDAPMNQDAGNVAAFGALVGEQTSDIDIVSVQIGYRF